MDIKVKNKIEKVVNCFETGSAEGDYSNISIYHDGPGNARQITYGRSQLTESGNLHKLIQEYTNTNGQYSKDFKPYVDRIGKTPYLVDDARLIKLLKDAGKDPVMVKTQDAVFDSCYWEPAFKWFTTNGFTKPLSMLVIYDSFIHSGGILDFLRKRFAESPPVKGGNEETWIKQYVNVRHLWLANHTNDILRNTVYRVKCFEGLIAAKDWDLKGPIVANGVHIPA